VNLNVNATFDVDVIGHSRPELLVDDNVQGGVQVQAQVKVKVKAQVKVKVNVD
jgi:hypothetical protein